MLAQACLRGPALIAIDTSQRVGRKLLNPRQMKTAKTNPTCSLVQQAPEGMKSCRTSLRDLLRHLSKDEPTRTSCLNRLATSRVRRQDVAS